MATGCVSTSDLRLLIDNAVLTRRCYAGVKALEMLESTLQADYDRLTNKQKCANGGENRDAQGIYIRHYVAPMYISREGKNMGCSCC